MSAGSTEHFRLANKRNEARGTIESVAFCRPKWCPMTDPKPRPNHKLYLQILRHMTPEQKLDKAFELSALAKDLFITGLRQRFPDLSEEEFKRLLLARL